MQAMIMIIDLLYVATLSQQWKCVNCQSFEMTYAFNFDASSHKFCKAGAW